MFLLPVFLCFSFRLRRSGTLFDVGDHRFPQPHLTWIPFECNSTCNEKTEANPRVVCPSLSLPIPFVSVMGEYLFSIINIYELATYV